MLGSSRTSFDAAREALAERAAADATLAGELLSVSRVLAGTSALRNALSDSGTEVAARTALARSVFEGKISAAALEVVSDAVGRRWNSSVDLVDAVEGLGFEAALLDAERAGRLDAVEDELFRVDRLVAADEPLRQALSDPAVDTPAKADLLDGLLSGKVDETTAALIRHVVENPRGRRLTEALESLVEQSARRRERLLAKVTVAAALSAEQESRLTAALARIYRRDVDLQVEIDPELLGGVRVRIGDEVIDGSVSHRLEQARRKFSGA
ncbi:F0F1 ATP synthase subunit delta [Phytoactinopolyspora alkaliphila]|uniref:ATP synthase subunit delta n=1 Tax=Phytoactinopolyspora alkaliphila TaxID=1783498 RepID=A0A6N9YT26_9ACTN|nr:F0F1 ATP synthase subunit delta [Phytoactinopolyspora alkaliphila]NED98124.1 F0F1 ATP synthase subunit delta [Phytoactinopolyspora alkaliphila]